MDAMRSTGRRTYMHTETRLPFWAIVSRVVWYLLGVIEALLGFRFLLRLFAANAAAPFVQFIYTMTEPLVAPFRGIFGTPAANGAVFEPATLIAMAVYALVAWGIVRLFELAARPHADTIQHVEEDRAEESDVVEPTDTTDAYVRRRDGMYYDNRNHPHPVA